MPGNIDFKIEGAREMEKLLFALGPAATKRVGRQTLRAGAKPVIDEAKRLIPVETGKLRDALAVRVLKPDAEGITAELGALQPTSRRLHLIEFGTQHSAARPFFRPAMDSKKREALDGMGNVMAKGIEREAKKLVK